MAFPAPHPDERSRLVCVIDDDVSLLRALRRLLDAGGFQVKTFSSAEDFLDRPNPTPPGCLVLDVHLGGLSGFELLERLVAAGRRIPVVEYLRKPFDDESLIAGVNRALGPA